MSNYGGRWSGNGSAYETGYSSGTGNDYSASYSSSGNQSGYGGSGSAGSYGGGDTSMYGGSLSTSYDAGSNYDSTSVGYGTGSSSYNTGDSSYGTGSYMSGASSYSTGGTSGYGGGSTRASGNSGSNYDSFLSTQQNQVTDMSKKLRKMEMMQEIAKLEQEDDMEELMLKKKLESLRQQRRMKQINMPPMNSYNNNNNFGGGMGMGSPMAPMGRHAGGYGNRGNFGNQRNNPMGRNVNRGDRGRSGNRGGGAMRGNRQGGGGNRNDRRNSSGPGKTDNHGSPKKTGRFADRNTGNDKGQDRKRKQEGTKSTNNDRNAKKPRHDNKAVNEKERDEKLKKVMEALKTFADKTDAVSTFYSALRSINVRADIKYFQKTGALFFDRLYLGRGRKNAFKQMAFKEALEKLKTLSLDKIKAEAAEVSSKSAVVIERDGNNKHSMSDIDESYRSPIEFADLPFVERLGLFIEALKIYGLLNIRIFCAKYMINCIQIYEFHENESLPHEHHLYLNEVYIASARGAFKKESDMETMNKMVEILEDKSLEEIMKNDNRFSKDYPKYPLYVKDVGIGNEITETNHLDLKFGQNIQDFEALKSNDVGDIIMIEEAAWRSSRFKVLQESATCSHMVLKCTWSTEHPGGSIDDDTTDVSEASKEEKDYKETLKKIRKIAIEKKVMMIHCKIELQDKLIGRSVDTAKGLALKNASIKAYTKLQETQSVICHDYGGKKLDSKQYQWDELVVKAKELRKEVPKAPNFDHVKASMPSSEDEDLENSMEEEHGNDEAEVKEENGEEEVKEEENGEKEDKAKSEAKKKEEEELAPWIKEVVRREIEELSNTDILVESILLFHKPPMYVRDVVNHYTVEYSVSLKTDWKVRKISRLSIRKKLPNVFTLLDRLKAIKEKKSETFILEQSKKADGTIEKHHERIVRRWQKPRNNTRNRRFKRR